MIKLWENLKKAWNALSYGDQAEFLSFEEKCKVLGVEPTEDYPRYIPHVHRGPRRKVALYVECTLKEWLVKYAIMTCQKEKAGLLILSQNSPAALNKIVRPYIRQIEKAQISYKLVGLDNTGMRGLRACLYNHSRILCLIAGNARIFTEDNPLLSVPLIVISRIWT